MTNKKGKDPRYRMPKEVIEIAKKHENVKERAEIYGKAAIYSLEGIIMDERMTEYLDPNERRRKRMKGNTNSAGHTVKQSGTHCSKNRAGHTVKPKSKTREKEISDETLAIYICNNSILYDIVCSYIHNNITFYSIEYQINKHGEKKYIYSQMKEAEKIIKKVGLETFTTILNFVQQDEFWRKNILSISKLNRKNKDGVPYYVIMMEKIKNYTPKVVSIPTV